MSQSIPAQDLTNSLITLKSQYEQALAEAHTNASHLREQLSHVNALLLNLLLQGNGVVPQQTHRAVDVAVVEAIAPYPTQPFAPSPAAQYCSVKAYAVL